MNIFVKFFEWFKASNRWKHFVGGIMIGLLSNTVYCAALSGIGIASALEFKDMQWGGKWDWIDWSLTVIGTAIGYLLRLLLLSIIII